MAVNEHWQYQGRQQHQWFGGWVSRTRARMRVGYARVSTTDQSPELQLNALRRAGCEKICSEKASSAKADRPELTRILDDVLRHGDVLVV